MGAAIGRRNARSAGGIAAGMVLVGSTAVTAWAEERPDVTPYRPSVSTPAALSAPGWLEVEAGVQDARGDGAQRRASLPYTLKLAFTPDWGVRLGGDAWVRQVDDSGATTRGGGDTSIVLKRRFELNAASAFGLELGVKLPTAAHDLGSGHSDVGANGIFSSDFAEGWHVDLNLGATRLGGVAADLGRWQKAAAAAVSRNLNEQWGVVGELSGTAQAGVPGTRQALVAASYSLQRGVTLDAGVSKGLNSASGGWSLFTGATFLAWQLF